MEYWDGDTLDASVRASKIGRMLLENLMKKKISFDEKVPLKSHNENRIYRENLEPSYSPQVKEPYIPFQSFNTIFDNNKIFDTRLKETDDRFVNFGTQPVYPQVDNRYQYFQERNEIYQTRQRTPRPIFNRCIDCGSSHQFHQTENANVIHSHRSHRISHGNGIYSNVEVYRQFNSLYPNFK